MNDLHFSRPSDHHVRDIEAQVRLALESGDDELLWKHVRHHPEEDRLYGVIAEEAPRLVRRVGIVPWFSELMLVPIIEEDAGTVIDSAPAWAAAEGCAVHTIEEWFGGRGRLTIFRRVVPYEWIAGWEPLMLRQHLQAAVPSLSCGSVTFQPSCSQVPEGAPRLGFVAFTVACRQGWPQLPSPSTLRDARFRAVLGYALGLVSSRESVDVLPPDQVCPALADGLCLWLACVHESTSIERWQMRPSARRIDAVQVEARLRDGSPLQFEVRRHQIGPQGIDCLRAMLERIAPEATEEPRH